MLGRWPSDCIAVGSADVGAGAFKVAGRGAEDAAVEAAAVTGEGHRDVAGPVLLPATLGTMELSCQVLPPSVET